MKSKLNFNLNNFATITIFSILKRSEIDENKKHIRNFIIFSDETTLNENFKKSEQKTSNPKFCVITGLPAKYFDPATQSPYANLYAYKVLKDLNKQKQSVKNSS
jgi:vacuolar protein sorting-associated protein 72